LLEGAATSKNTSLGGRGKTGQGEEKKIARSDLEEQMARENSFEDRLLQKHGLAGQARTATIL